MQLEGRLFLPELPVRDYCRREREGTESVTGIKLGFQKDQNKSVTGGSVGTKKSVSGISVGVFMLAAVNEF